MTQYISKSALVAEIERRIADVTDDCNKNKRLLFTLHGYINALEDLLPFINTLEVKEVGISIPNIDDLFEENGIDHNSKVAKNFKESYYMALENFKAQKGE